MFGWLKTLVGIREKKDISIPLFIDNTKMLGKRSFETVMSELEIKDAFCPDDLYKAITQNTGSSREQTKAALEVMPDESWEWYVYDNLTLSEQQDIYDEDVADINESSLESLLPLCTVAQLKKVHSEVLGKPAKSSFRKAQIIQAVQSGAVREALPLIKKELINKLSAHDVINYKDKVETLVYKIIRAEYAAIRLEQLKRTADTRPYLQFNAVGDSRDPDECKRLDGTTKHHSDPFWEKHMPPCWRPECRCTIRTLNDRQLKREGLRVS